MTLITSTSAAAASREGKFRAFSTLNHQHRRRTDFTPAHNNQLHISIRLNYLHFSHICRSSSGGNNNSLHVAVLFCLMTTICHLVLVFLSYVRPPAVISTWIPTFTLDLTSSEALMKLKIYSWYFQTWHTEYSIILTLLTRLNTHRSDEFSVTFSISYQTFHNHKFYEFRIWNFSIFRGANLNCARKSEKFFIAASRISPTSATQCGE